MLIEGLNFRDFKVSQNLQLDVQYKSTVVRFSDDQSGN